MTPTANRYLALLKAALTDTLGKYLFLTNDGRNCVMYENTPDHPRHTGMDWPFNAATMVGRRRLDQYQQAIEWVVANKVPGDIIECGIWRGGCGILAAAVLDALGVRDRSIWLCDSFCGVPAPACEQDKGINLSDFPYLAVPMEEVQQNFIRFGVNDNPIRFIKGLFKDTLPKMKGRYAVIRADGNLYSSSMEILTNLYPSLSTGGICIIGDFGHIPACRKAVEEFRALNNCTAEIKKIDSQGVFWIKSESELGPVASSDIVVLDRPVMTVQEEARNRRSDLSEPLA